MTSDLPLNALLVARGLLDRAVASADQTAPGAIAGVVLSDLAVETAAKAVLGSVGNPAEFPGGGYFMAVGELRKPAKKDERLSFVLDRLLAQHRLRTGEASDLQGRDGVRRLRDYRNGVQHDGNVPSGDDIVRSRYQALEFLDGLLESFYGMRLNEVSRASLIADSQISRLIREAEDAADIDDLDEAGKRLSVAFGLARIGFRTGEPYERRFKVRATEVRKALVGVAPDAPSSNSLKTKLRGIFKGLGLTTQDAQAVTNGVFMEKADGGKRLAALLEGVLREMSVLSDRVEAFSAAGDPGEFAWFRRRFPPASFYWGGEEMNWQVAAPEPALDRGEFLRAMDFVVATALRWQDSPPQDDLEGDATDGSSDLEQVSH